jgi:hypothetical protein
MDLKNAVKSYQYAERAKSELIVCSQLVMALAGFPDQERGGAKRMLIMVLESVRSELQFAYGGTEQQDFRRAMELMSEAISMVESDQFGAASLKLSESISAVTTVAQGAWQVLSEHGLI